MPHNDVEKTLAAWREAERRAAITNVGSDARRCAERDLVACRAAYQAAVRSLPPSLVADELMSAGRGTALGRDQQR